MITIENLKTRARNAIEKDEHFIYDVAAEHGQMLENVKHMDWFLIEVCRCLCNDYQKYQHLIGELPE